jgi:hypothetical protein
MLFDLEGAMRKAAAIAAAMGLFAVLGGTLAMAEDTPEITELKAQKAKLDAEKDVLASELEKLKAQRNLDQEGALAAAATAKAKLEAQTAIFNADKAQSQAAVEAVNAEVAAAKAKMGVGLIPGTNLSGSVTLSASAGNFESSLLAAKALERAAEQIVERTGKQPETHRYVLFTGVTRPSFADLGVFNTKVAIITRGYANADARIAKANAAYEAAKTIVATPPKTGPATESIVATAAAAGAALDTLSKLGSYFQSEYTVSNATITGADSDLLAVSLASRLTNAWYPARWPPPRDKLGILGLLDKLPDLRQSGADKLVQMLDLQKSVTEAATTEKDAKLKKALEEVAALYGLAATALSEANKAYDDLIVSLAEADTSGVARITRLAEQKAISDELQKGSQAILINVAGAGGTTYTKKNLWTFFGGMPFYVSGGAIASYLVFDNDGVIKASGQIPLHSGFTRVQAVPDILNPPPKN